MRQSQFVPDIPNRMILGSPEFELDRPSVATDKVVVFLPGISGEALSNRFQPLVDACLAAGLAIARLNVWKDATDVAGKNLSEIYTDLGVITTRLHREFPYMFGIGKSFGGAVLLLFPGVYTQRKVLWAPAVGVAEVDANVGAYMSAPLGSLQSLLDLKVDRAFLKDKSVPTLLIHGTADDSIPFSNSEILVSMLPNAKLFPIEGADHSYRNKVHEDAVIRATLDFLIAA